MTYSWRDGGACAGTISASFRPKFRACCCSRSPQTPPPLGSPAAEAGLLGGNRGHVECAGDVIAVNDRPTPEPDRLSTQELDRRAADTIKESRPKILRV